MKKSIFVLLSILLLFASSVTVFAAPVANYKTELEPYQSILDKINLEYGLEGDSRIRILNGEEEAVY
ncbi:MAG TPA: hypothetical protein GX523_19200, partial [Desulfitobacterium dehalogenans]|nr:hypothetical protein [Desulfitobacterium dehalogenans]